MDNRDHIPIEFMRRASTAVPPSVLEEYANHRLHFVVRRFAFQLRRITVRLDDENGPRRGEDSRCVISVELNHGAPIVVEATTPWPTAAITAAARRLSEVIRRRIDREHTLRRHSAGRRPPALSRTIATRQSRRRASQSPLQRRGPPTQSAE